MKGVHAAIRHSAIWVFWPILLTHLWSALAALLSFSCHRSKCTLRGAQVLLLIQLPACCCLCALQNLWPIFLTHLMEVLHSGNSVTRAAGLEALDRCLTGGPRCGGGGFAVLSKTLHRTKGVAMHLAPNGGLGILWHLVASWPCLIFAPSSYLLLCVRLGWTLLNQSPLHVSTQTRCMQLVGLGGTDCALVLTGATAAPDLGQVPTQPQQPHVPASVTL